MSETATVPQQTYAHTTVMPREVVEHLLTDATRVVVDGTLGGGGHSEALLQAAAARGQALLVIGVDRDPEALAAARARLADFGAAFEAVEGNFGDLLGVLERLGRGPVDALVVDAGVSSHQLDTASRGFAFSKDGPLDMRMGADGPTAAERLDDWSEAELADVLHHYGEVRGSRRLAAKIKAARAEGRLERTSQLASLCGRPSPRDRIHPATTVFQAIRIAVNDELGALERLIGAIDAVLAPGGRGAIISFHSLEDRIVKHGLRALARGCICPPGLVVCACGHVPTLRVKGSALRPTAEEIEQNPRSRSARLRVCERV